MVRVAEVVSGGWQVAEAFAGKERLVEVPPAVASPAKALWVLAVVAEAVGTAAAQEAAAWALVAVVMVRVVEEMAAAATWALVAVVMVRVEEQTATVAVAMGLVAEATAPAAVTTA